MIVSSSLEDMDTTLRHQKAALRKQMNQVLSALPKHEVVRQSEIVTDKVLQHPKYVEAQSVSVYLSFDQEIQTGDLLEDIFKSGKICYIPRFRKGSSEMEMIRLFSMEDLNKLPVNKWNIRQPLDDEIRESVFEAGKLDLVLNPGLVFTPDGKRLGRGKAYYDQFLHKCSKQLKNSPVTLALAFKEQILPHLPTTPTDYIMDYVLYEDWG